MSPLLLRTTTATVIQGDITETVVTKDLNSDTTISLTSLAESGSDLHKYLLTLSALRRWFPRYTKQISVVFMRDTIFIL
jgi:hypothetical protein